MLNYLALGLSTAGIVLVPFGFKRAGNDHLGPLCVYFAWYCIVWIDRSVVFVINDLELNEGALALLAVAHYGLLFLIVWSYLTAMLASPGYTVKKSGKEKFDASVRARVAEKVSAKPDIDVKQLRRRVRKNVASQLRYCKYCESIKPASTHHCGSCKRCVHRMDHHCPWINNCVGKCNLKYFLQFLVYTEIGVVVSFGLMLAVGTGALKTATGRQDSVPNEVKGLYVVSTLFIGLFALFVGVMIYEQYEALSSGIPGIDALQGTGKWRDRTLYAALKEDAFSERDIDLLWFLPLPPPAPVKRARSRSSKRSLKLRAGAGR